MRNLQNRFSTLMRQNGGQTENLMYFEKTSDNLKRLSKNGFFQLHLINVL